jgi:HSP20 family molecular chaperone IbpA
VKAEDIKAAYKDGVLELTAPAPRETAARKVAIEVEEGKK